MVESQPWMAARRPLHMLFAWAVLTAELLTAGMQPGYMSSDTGLKVKKSLHLIARSPGGLVSGGNSSGTKVTLHHADEVLFFYILNKGKLKTYTAIIVWPGNNGEDMGCCCSIPSDIAGMGAGDREGQGV